MRWPFTERALPAAGALDRRSADERTTLEVDSGAVVLRHLARGDEGGGADVSHGYRLPILPDSTMVRIDSSAHTFTLTMSTALTAATIWRSHSASGR